MPNHPICYDSFPEIHALSITVFALCLSGLAIPEVLLALQFCVASMPCGSLPEQNEISEGEHRVCWFLQQSRPQLVARSSLSSKVRITGIVFCCFFYYTPTSSPKIRPFSDTISRQHPKRFHLYTAAVQSCTAVVVVRVVDYHRLLIDSLSLYTVRVLSSIFRALEL